MRSLTGDQTYAIVTAAATSSDAAYNGFNATDVSVSNTDDDAVGHHGQHDLRADHH